LATGKRKSSSGRKTSGRKTNSGRKKNDMQQESFTEEVILWVILAVSILLFISNFGIGGAIGNAVSSFFFGVFGLIAYIFPVVLVIGTFFAASNKGNRIAMVKIVAAVFFVLFLCMFIEIVRCGAEVVGAAGAYQYCSVHKIGGGFLGGLLAGIFCPNFGLLGSYVIDVVAMIICLVLITERSALKGVQKGSRKVYETAKESNERHRELAEQRREERELRRMDRKVEGVAVDTRVLPDRKAEPMGSDEVSEINIDKLLGQSNANLPEIKEEKHVTLTAGGAEYQKLPAMEPETEPYVAPSAFSEEAFEAKELEEDASIFHTEPAYQESIHTEPAYEGHHPVEESIPYDVAEKPEEPHVRAEKVELHSERTEKPKKNVKATEEDIQNDVSSIEEEIHLEAQKERKYVFPPVAFLLPVQSEYHFSFQNSIPAILFRILYLSIQDL
jgi:DNA segregation ATPase FtsK/SpoIIIE, S-DNA-T family